MATDPKLAQAYHRALVRFVAAVEAGRSAPVVEALRVKARKARALAYGRPDCQGEAVRHKDVWYTL